MTSISLYIPRLRILTMTYNVVGAIHYYHVVIVKWEPDLRLPFDYTSLSVVQSIIKERSICKIQKQ